MFNKWYDIFENFVSFPKMNTLHRRMFYLNVLLGQYFLHDTGRKINVLHGRAFKKLNVKQIKMINRCKVSLYKVMF